jgi:hypothetical protein
MLFRLFLRNSYVFFYVVVFDINIPTLLLLLYTRVWNENWQRRGKLTIVFAKCHEI